MSTTHCFRCGRVKERPGRPYCVACLREYDRARYQKSRKGGARPVSLGTAKGLRELEAGREEFPVVEEQRPRTRGECVGGPRPCPWVGCRHHLYLDVSQQTGSLKLNFPDLEVGEIRDSCSLDVADEEGVTVDRVASALNVTRERARQLVLGIVSKLVGDPRVVEFAPVVRHLVLAGGTPAPSTSTERGSMDDNNEAAPADGETLQGQVERLADYFTQVHPEAILGGGAVDCALRVMKTLDRLGVFPMQADLKGERDPELIATKGTDPMLRWFAFEHLPPNLRSVSRPFGVMAQTLVDSLPQCPERTVALRKLLEGKDAAVRAALL